MFEVFDYRDGTPLHTVRWEWLARLLSRRGFMEYARQGQGWQGYP